MKGMCAALPTIPDLPLATLIAMQQPCLDQFDGVWDFTNCFLNAGLGKGSKKFDSEFSAHSEQSLKTFEESGAEIDAALAAGSLEYNADTCAMVFERKGSGAMSVGYFCVSPPSTSRHAEVTRCILAPHTG